MASNENEQLLLHSTTKYSEQEDEEEKEKEKESKDTRIMDIEPVMFVYALYISSFLLYAEQYIFESISLKYNFTTLLANTTVCSPNDSHINTDLNIQQEIQEESSKVMLILTIATTIPALLSTLFLGPYCDKYGKKLAISLSLFGAAFKCAIYAIVIAAELNYWWLLIGCIFEGFTGFLYTFNMAAYAYSSDVSSTKKRTWKITVVEELNFIALGIGQAVTGPIINSIGYMYPFIILAIILALSIIYVIVLLPETLHTTETITTKMRHVFDMHNIKTCAVTFLHNDESNRCSKLLLYLLIVITLIPGSLAKWDAQTYFLKGAPICFSPNQVGYFTGGMTLFQSLGNLALVFFCETILGDIWILVIGLTSGILHMVTFAFVKNLQILLLVPALGIFALMPMTMVRSITSKIVQPNEQGAMFAGIAFAESVGHIIGISTFNSVYAASLHIMPGFVFFIMAVTFAVSLVLTFVLMCLSR